MHVILSILLHHRFYFFFFFFLMIRRPPRSTLFPYTTLFRSRTGVQPFHPLFDQASSREHQDRGFYPSLAQLAADFDTDRKSTRLNSSHGYISYAVFCLKKKKKLDDEVHVVSSAYWC